MSLNKLTNQNLHLSLVDVCKSEREILTQAILHIVEVERRKLYLTFSYPSLFEYLTKSIGYSNGSAQRRIDAARLSFDAPEVIEKIESGELNLAQVSLLQMSIREVQVTSKHKVDADVKSDLIEQLINKSYAESEVLVAQTLEIKPKEHSKEKHQSDESVRLEVTLSKNQWSKLMKMRELLSLSLPNGSSWDQVLEHVADKVIKQKDKTRIIKTGPKEKSNEAKAVYSIRTRKATAREATAIEVQETIASGTQEAKSKEFKNVNSQSISSSKELGSIELIKTHLDLNLNAKEPKNPPARTHIPMSIQRQIFHRDMCCQYKDKSTGKICATTWQLTIDHIKPVWAGGDNDPENLRVLCAAHNQETYRMQANLAQTALMFS
jgi:hypothetical protein